MPHAPPAVTEAELAVLELLWLESPRTARQLTEQLYPPGTPSDVATVQKLLQRLEAKELVARDRSQRVHTFRSDPHARRVRGEPACGSRAQTVRRIACPALAAPRVVATPERCGTRRAAKGARRRSQVTKGPNMTANALLTLGLTNAALATLLAVAGWCLTRVWKNPHVASIVWLVVLLKLVTPPLVPLPIALNDELVANASPLRAAKSQAERSRGMTWRTHGERRVSARRVRHLFHRPRSSSTRSTNASKRIE